MKGGKKGEAQGEAAEPGHVARTGVRQLAAPPLAPTDPPLSNKRPVSGAWPFGKAAHRDMMLRDGSAASMTLRMLWATIVRR
mmetsp:Transcript_58495/g.161885  ORF Transcript_58495/g.161885 Transcript_58495/m.161885 type:complete len:82 (+) Transcript_58495:2-247(+)